MQIIPLYKYIREDGGVTVSPVKPEGVEYTAMFRIVADEGEAITNGEIVTSCIDADSADGWTAIPAEDESSDEQYAEAGRILMGVNE